MSTPRIWYSRHGPSMQARSRYFRNCIAAFEGGGILGFAHAGAVAAAESRGVHFSAAVGTSAGSIAAAMVAAGMRGDEMLDEIRNVNPELFISEPVSLTGLSRHILSTIVAIKYGHKGFIATKAILVGGLYSSAPIGAWLNDVLRRKLGLDNSVVRFDDLPKPLAVVSADVDLGMAKTWTSAADPQASVAHAVRCSCTIPFFFQPVEHEGRAMVDGGILSNLPVHEMDSLPHSEGVPLLAFRLLNESRSLTSGLPAGGLMFQRLVRTIINGHTQLQLRVVPQCQVITIRLKGVDSTTFRISKEEVQRLVDAGADATNDFFDDEQARVVESGFLQGSLRQTPILNALEHTLSFIERATARIIVFAGDISWAKRLAPAFHCRVKDGISINVLYDETAARELIEILTASGCEVRRSPRPLHVRGTIVDPDTRTSSGILVSRRDMNMLSGRTLDAEHDTNLLSLLVRRFDECWQDAPPHPPLTPPRVDRVNSNALIVALRSRVRQYQGPLVQIRCEYIDVSRTVPLSRYLESFRLVRSELVARVLQDANLELFEPARIAGSPWVISPPVVEVVDNRLIVVDGTHRMFYCVRAGISTIRAIVVSGIVDPLPASPLPSWNIVRPIASEVSREERYVNFNPREFRDLRGAWEAVV